MHQREAKKYGQTILFRHKRFAISKMADKNDDLMAMSRESFLSYMESLPDGALTELLSSSEDVRRRYYGFDIHTSQVNKSRHSGVKGRALGETNIVSSLYYVSDNMASAMQLQDLVKIHNRVVATIDIVLSWWLLHVKENNLVDDKFRIKPDKSFAIAFGNSLSRFGDSLGYYDLVDMVHSNLEEVNISDVNLSEKEVELLYNHTQEIKGLLESY